MADDLKPFVYFICIPVIFVIVAWFFTAKHQDNEQRDHCDAIGGELVRVEGGNYKCFDVKELK